MKKSLKCLLAWLMILCIAAPAAYASGEPSAEEVSEQTAEEEPVMQTVFAGETEVSDIFDGMDPEDPMYACMQESLVTLDGAGSNTFSDFTPRETEQGEILYKGIDVSAWQGSIDWNAVKAAGVQFAIIRGAYRGSGNGSIAKDSWFETNIKNAQKAGILVGVYIFSQAITVSEGRAEAQYLIDLVEDYDIDLPLVIDFEYAGNGGRLYNARLSKREATDICNAFCDTAEAAGYESMVYANPSMLSSQLYAGELGRLWLAHYIKKTGYSARGYEYWQCSGTGRVSGISGDVDLDFWFRPIELAQSTGEKAKTFTDVTADDWFYEAVMAAYKDGVVKGTSETEFSPEEIATRGQVITMLYRWQGSPETDEETEFSDLTEEYYKTPIAWAVKKGVTNGTSATTFSPDSTITREDLATMLWRLSGSPDSTGSTAKFSDAADIDDYAVTAMAWAVEKGILNGCGDGTIAPLRSASRAEVCAMLMRAESLS